MIITIKRFLQIQNRFFLFPRFEFEIEILQCWLGSFLAQVCLFLYFYTRFHFLFLLVFFPSSNVNLICSKINDVFLLLFLLLALFSPSISLMVILGIASYHNIRYFNVYPVNNWRELWLLMEIHKISGMLFFTFHLLAYLTANHTKNFVIFIIFSEWKLRLAPKTPKELFFHSKFSQYFIIF
jgi:hypothetical protein